MFYLSEHRIFALPLLIPQFQKPTSVPRCVSKSVTVLNQVLVSNNLSRLIKNLYDAGRRVSPTPLSGNT